MKLKHEGRDVDVFIISPRAPAPGRYWREIEQTVDWSARYGATGVLLFTGNDTLVDPWIAAHAAIARSPATSPLVAVNPIYMHPFTAAKMVSSFSYLHQRRTYLNMVTGTAVSYLTAMNDCLSRDQRYDRLVEYAQVMWRLLSARRPVSFDGAYYKLDAVQMLPPVPAELLPRFFVAGQSEAARRAARAISGICMQMLSPMLVSGLEPGVTGIHFGVVTRASEVEAWAAARRQFPEDEIGREMLAASMANTDSAWKQRLFQAAQLEQDAAPGFWLGPFRNYQADCPYLVGSSEFVADVVVGLIRGGVEAFILDVPAREEEHAALAAAFSLAQRRLSGEGRPPLQ